MRSYKNGISKIAGFLDDYAFVIDAYLEVYLITQNEDWLNLANSLTEYTLENFYDQKSGLFFYTDKSAVQLPIRTTEIHDNVIPSSNSQMARNLHRLHQILDIEDYENISVNMIARFNKEIIHYGSGYSNWASLYLDLLNDAIQVCIVGKDVEEKLLELNNHYIPNAIFVVAASVSEIEILKQRFISDKTLIYVCKNKSCLLPVSAVKDALQQLEILN